MTFGLDPVKGPFKDIKNNCGDTPAHKAAFFGYLPENGWVKINHFEAEKLVNLAEQQDEELDNGLRM